MQHNMAGIFPQFAATAATFGRASTLITRVGTDAHLYDDPQDANIASLLDSKYDAEKAEGMKRLIALMSQGVDVAQHFPQVVKNIVSTSLEVKKLVYIYLVHFAEKRPDEALLSINSFQKDLSDVNPLVRAWSLRAISGIRVRVVLPIVVMAVSKAARDPSPYVRRCAAHAVPKVFSLEHEQHANVLLELIGLLLNDNSAGVVGAAAAAFTAVCPDKLQIIGPVFKKLCEMLPDVEEWGQVALLDVLIHFAMAKYGVPENSVGVLGLQGGPKSDGFAAKEGRLSDREGAASAGDVEELELPLSDLPWRHAEHEDDELHLELRHLIHCTSPLLWSHNSAVVMAAAVTYWLFAPRESLSRIAKPVLFLLRSSFDTQYVVLLCIATFVGVVPSLFEDFYEEFFVRPSDNQAIRAVKLDILTQVATETSIHAILEELQVYVRDPDRQFAADTVSAIGRCAARLPAIAAVCVDGLFKIIEISLDMPCWDQDANEESDTANKAVAMKRYPQGSSLADTRSMESVVITQSVMAIRLILQQFPPKHEAVFARLVRYLDRLQVPSARAIIIWMVGEYSSTYSLSLNILPVVLSYIAGTFTKEADETKLQILNCCVKIAAKYKAGPELLSNRAQMVLKYVLSLGCVDVSFDIRDRARMLRKLFVREGSEAVEPGAELSDTRPSTTQEGVSSCSDQGPSRIAGGSSPSKDEKALKNYAGILEVIADKLFLGPRPAPALPFLRHDRSSFLPGTMSHVVQHRAPGYRPLPEPCSLEEGEDVIAEEQAAVNGVSEEGSDGESGSEGVHSGSEGDDSGSWEEEESELSEEDTDHEERGSNGSATGESSESRNLIDL